ncbi:MAG: prenyltransferase [bacterium]|nr:prenyltransferase [bacterium]
MDAALDNGKTSFVKKSLAFIELGRAPFLSVIIFPFLLGTYFGAVVGGTFDLITFILSFIAVLLIPATANLLGEYYDFHGDTYGQDKGKNKFSGGSLIVQRGILGRKAPLIAGIVTATVAALLGLYIIFFRGGGWPALAMGAFGLLSGFFYSTKPIRLANLGIGEILIGICYGWLPIAVGCWLQAHALPAGVYWFAIPVALAIFNVILINEFPDVEADTKFDKRNLVVRLGKKAAAVIYVVAGVSIAVSLFAAVYILGFSPFAYIVVAVPAALALMNAFRVIAGHYKDHEKLEQICGMGILTNVLTGAALLAALFFFG